MPIGDSLAHLLFRIDAQMFGGQQVAGNLRAIGTELNKTQRNLDRASQSATTFAQKVTVGGQAASTAMQKAAQSSFRYTFYALMAMRAGQMLASAVFIKGMAKAANEYTHSLTRIQAVLQATADQMESIKAKAGEVVLKTPFGPTDTVEAMRNMAKQGLAVTQINNSIMESANLATMGEMSLTSGAELLTEVLRAYNMKMEEAGDVTALLGYAAKQSKYEVSDLKDILETVGPTAAAYGQSLPKTLQMLIAYGRKGVKPSEAATLIRQVIMRSAKPEVQEVLEWGLRQMGEKPLYNEEGYMTNIGQAMVATAKAFDKLRKQAQDKHRGAEFGAALDSLFYELFGVRQARGFMTLAGMSLKEYKELLPDVDKARKYEEEYMRTIKQDYHWVQAQAAATMQRLSQVLGTPMLQIMRPFKQIQAEAAGFITNLITMNKTASQLIPALTFLSGAIISLSSATGIAVGIFYLIRTRLADVGDALRETGRAAARLGRDAIAGLAPWKIGLKYFASYALGPARALASLSIAASILYYAWKHNLGGLQSFLKPFFNWWNKTMTDTGTLAERLSDKIRKLFKFPEIKMLSRPGVVGPAMLRDRILRVPQGGTVLGNIMYGMQQAANTTFGHMVGSVVSSIKAIVIILKYTALPVLKGFAGTLYYAFRNLAWVVGTGDIERGFRRIGNAIGWLIGLKLFDTLVGKILLLGKGLYRLYAILRIVAMPHADFSTAFSLLKGVKTFRGIHEAIAIAASITKGAFGKGASFRWLLGNVFKGIIAREIPTLSKPLAGMARWFLRPIHDVIAAAGTRGMRFSEYIPRAYWPATRALLEGRKGAFWGLAVLGRFKSIWLNGVSLFRQALVWAIWRYKVIVGGLERTMIALKAAMKAHSVAGLLGRGVRGIGTMFGAGISGLLALLLKAPGGLVGGIALSVLAGLLVSGLVAYLVSTFRRSGGGTSAPETPTSPTSYAPFLATQAAWSPAAATVGSGGINIVTYITAPAGTTKEQAEYMAAVIEAKIKEAARLAKELQVEEQQRREAQKSDYWNA